MTTPTAPDPQHAAQHRNQPSTVPEPRSYPFDEDHTHTTDPSPPTSAAATKTAPGVLVWRVVSFVIGCALLVWCAWALGDTIPRWSREHGRVLVFLLFFLVMSIGGRWFWMGVDAALNRVIGGRER